MNSLRFTGITLIALVAGCFNPKFASPGFSCSTDPSQGQDCPSGQTCVASGGSTQGQCVSTSGGSGSGGDNLSIAKTGTYMAPTSDPMLSMESQCPDASLEPDDDFGQSVPLPSIAVDGNPLKLQNLAICPTGNNPKAKNHDVDLFKLVVPQNLSVVVNISYDIQYGDLDLGIFDGSGNAVASDGSSQSNACVASTLSAGTYYVGVFGAMNMDVNRYSMTVKFTSAASSCP